MIECALPPSLTNAIVPEIEKNCFGGWADIRHRNDKKTERNTSGTRLVRLNFSGG
jgi:hypothetical protein